MNTKEAIEILEKRHRYNIYCGSSEYKTKYHNAIDKVNESIQKL